jgi:hypothetical protein
MPTTEVLSKGSSDLFADLRGKPSGVDSPDFYRRRITIFGHTGAGKSTFVGTDPNLLKIDLDRKGAAPPGHEKCGRVPDQDFSGINWEWLCKVRDRLVDLAKKNTPDRPKMVVVDSAWELVGHAMGKVALDKGREFHEIDPRTSYNHVNQQIVAWLWSLINAGYGVCLLAHIDTKTIRQGDNTLLVDSVGVPDSCWRSLSKMMNIVGVLESKVIDEMEPVIDEKTGQPVLLPVVKTPKMKATGRKKTSRLFRLNFNDNPTHPFSKIVRPEGPMQNIENIELFSGFQSLKQEFERAQEELASMSSD